MVSVLAVSEMPVAMLSAGAGAEGVAGVCAVSFEVVEASRAVSAGAFAGSVTAGTVIFGVITGATGVTEGAGVFWPVAINA